jgi:type I restriction-modification system DNA methylase subunit
MLDDIKRALWATADKLRANIDAAEYKHWTGQSFIDTHEPFSA